MLAHVGLAACDRDNPVGCDRIPDAGIEIPGGGERLIRAEKPRNGGIAKREAGGSTADEERAAAEVGGLAVGTVVSDIHVRVHVALRSVPALEAVRISEAALMIAF